MVVKVCDAIMGSGKSQSAISYINENSNKRFVYITPYLDEADRICRGCPDANFVQPSNKLADNGFSKLEHTRCLLADGKNIATTHSAFKAYTKDMIESIKKYEYVLIVDESVEVFNEAEYNDGDIKLLIDGGYVRDDNGVLVCTGKEYRGTRLSDLFCMFKCNNLVQVDRKAHGKQYFYWTIPYDIITSFSEVIVLTYLFESQEMKYFLDMNKIEYEYIGIKRSGDVYRFTDKKDYVPGYVKEILSKIHILDNQKMNSVGDGKYSLSATWMKKNIDGVNALKTNVYNYLHNGTYVRGKYSGEDIMWSTYNDNERSICGKGFKKQYTSFNLKASNNYRNKKVLAYCVNVFASPSKTTYFSGYGIKYDDDGYALSVMIQWIWRSAIRDGRDIWIYIPSARMRNLLIGWLESLQK